MKNNSRVRLIQCAALACLLGAAGCATNPAPVVTLNAVGPKPGRVQPPGPMQGWLEVYTATTEYNNGGLMYYPHTAYSIQKEHGVFYKRVENRENPVDEKPQLVALPAGTYHVLARSDREGMVRVPVIIKEGRTTVVNLESDRAGGAESRTAQSSRGRASP